MSKKNQHRAASAPTVEPEQADDTGTPADITPPTLEVDAGDGDTVTKCPSCASTGRVNVAETGRMEHDGELIVWERCSCPVCGTARVDRIAKPIKKAK